MKEWPDDESRLKRPMRTKPLTLPRPERMSARILASCLGVRRLGVFVVGQPVPRQRQLAIASSVSSSSISRAGSSFAKRG